MVGCEKCGRYVYESSICMKDGEIICYRCDNE